MVLERDEKVIEFLQIFRLATSNQINQVQYNNINVCNRRLKKLCDDKILYRDRNKYGLGYLYSTTPIKSQVQLKHKLLRVDFYLMLKQVSAIDLVVSEPEYGSVRPDLVLTCKYNGKWYFMFVEIETSNNTINTYKYNNFMLKEVDDYFQAKPLVVYVTDKNIPDDARFKYVKIKPDLSNILNIFNRG